MIMLLPKSPSATSSVDSIVSIPAILIEIPLIAILVSLEILCGGSLYVKGVGDGIPL